MFLKNQQQAPLLQQPAFKTYSVTDDNSELSFS